MICPVELANEMSARSADRGKGKKIRYGPLPQVRDGAGNDDTGSGVAGHGQEDHVVGSGGDHRHQRPADAPVAWTLAALRLGRIAGPKTAASQPAAGAGGDGGTGAPVVSRAIPGVERAAFSREAGGGAPDPAELYLGEERPAAGRAGRT